MCKKKTEEVKKGSVYMNCNEGLYKTKTGEVVRLKNIDVYFDSHENESLKSTLSYDTIRNMLIEKCYTLETAFILNDKTVFEHNMLTEINAIIQNTGINCTSFTIEETEKVY